MAFFDPALYEGLRKLVLAAQREDQHVSEMGIALSSLSSSSLASLYLSSLSPSPPLSLSLSLSLSSYNVDLSWQVRLSESEGGGTHCLLSSLSDKPIVAADVLEYVRRYAELRMIKVIEEPLQVSISHVLYLSLFVWLYVCMHLIYSMSVVNLSVSLSVSLSLSLSLSLCLCLSVSLSLSLSLSGHEIWFI